MVFKLVIFLACKNQFNLAAKQFVILMVLNIRIMLSFNTVGNKIIYNLFNFAAMKFHTSGWKI